MISSLSFKSNASLLLTRSNHFKSNSPHFSAHFFKKFSKICVTKIHQNRCNSSFFSTFGNKDKKEVEKLLRKNPSDPRIEWIAKNFHKEKSDIMKRLATKLDLVKTSKQIKAEELERNKFNNRRYDGIGEEKLSIKSFGAVLDRIVEKKVHKGIASLNPKLLDSPHLGEEEEWDDEDSYDSKSIPWDDTLPVRIDENIQTFEGLGIPPLILNALKSMGIDEPTSVQKNAIQVINGGGNVFFQSDTGSGKTIAFLLPLLQKIVPETVPEGKSLLEIILSDKQFKKAFMIIVPTQDLAIQVDYVLRTLVGSKSKDGGLSHLVIAGKEADEHAKQIEKEGSRFIIGTPKHFEKLMNNAKGKNICEGIKVLVMDETDKCIAALGRYATQKEMLKRRKHLPAGEIVLTEFKKLPGNRQLVCSSATVNYRIKSKMNAIWRSKIQVVIAGANFVLPRHIKSEVIFIYPNDVTPDYKAEYKFAHLDNVHVEKVRRVISYLEEHNVQRALVIAPDGKDLSYTQFIESRKIKAFPLAFSRKFHREAFLNGSTNEDEEDSALSKEDERKNHEEFLKSFEKGEIQLAVTTETGCRGLDYPFLTHVFILDVPISESSYIHIAGRTGRMNKPGTAVSIVGPSEYQKFNTLENYLQVKLNRVNGEMPKLPRYMDYKANRDKEQKE